MTRKELFDAMNLSYPAHWISQPEGECVSPYVVIKYKNQSLSLGNSKAGWQYVDIMMYIPMASIVPLDTMALNVVDRVRSMMEYTGNITPDFVDADVKAIMRSIEFRIPKVIK